LGELALVKLLLVLAPVLLLLLLLLTGCCCCGVELLPPLLLLDLGASDVEVDVARLELLLALDTDEAVAAATRLSEFKRKLSLVVRCKGELLPELLLF